MTTFDEMDEELQLPSVKWFLEKSGNNMGKNVAKRNNYKTCASRPPYSYSQIIVHAFFYYGFRKLALSEIYDFFLRRYGYFRQEKSSWRNSVRHLLSLDKRFIKVPRERGERGKGAFWLLDKDAVEEDGTLKPMMVTRQCRKMPIPKRNNNKRDERLKATSKTTTTTTTITDDEMKPHINPIVQKYIERIRLNRQDSESSSSAESSSVMSGETALSSPDSNSGNLLIPISYEYESSSYDDEQKQQNDYYCQLPQSQQSSENAFIINSTKDEELFVFNMDNVNFELPTSDEFDELLDDEFLQYYSNYSDEISI
uniref:Fork-head domain-containing protein n=1 Tax=Panagrolaimus sp. ES5 TaxID=591445 RepID=A0AC34GQ42_9BILA